MHWLYLPCVASTPALIVPVNKVDSPMGRGETVLVVENTEELLNVLLEILETSGYDVFSSTTPPRALKMLESDPTPPALLITDVVLPEMSGRDMANRAVSLYPSIKVMYMSGYTDDTVLRQNIQNLKETFLQKPFKRSDVLSKVRDLLDHEYPTGQS
jgi:CheY-like chemotaxis protein